MNEELKNLIGSEVRRAIKEYTTTNPIPVHLHNGIDSLQISPIDLKGFPTIEATDPAVAPTDTPINGTLRILYNGSKWYLWVRVNKLWKSVSLT